MLQDFSGKKWEVTVQTQAEAAQEPGDRPRLTRRRSESRKIGKRCSTRSPSMVVAKA